MTLPEKPDRDEPECPGLNNELGIAVVGHGDLIETQKGEWYMVLLGIRPYQKYIEDYNQYLPRKWIREPDRNKDAPV